MKTSLLTLPTVILISLILGCSGKESSGEAAQPIPAKAAEYTEDWASLGAHNEAPHWFKNAKFGIYFHWGLYSVPAFENEWYPRWMHFRDHKVYAHHKVTYGDPS